MNPFQRVHEVLLEPRPGCCSTRDRILAAANELFREQGFHATGIAAILKAAGVNSGSLYHFFPTKEDLLLALLDRYREVLRHAFIEPVFARVSDPIERIFGLLGEYRGMLESTGCGGGCPLGNLALELSDTHPAVRSKVVSVFDDWRCAVEECVRTARDRLPPRTDTHRLAGFVLTVMEGAVMQAKARRSLEPFDSSIAELRAHFDLLLSAEGAPVRARGKSRPLSHPKRKVS